jgi:hypothetical protein
MTHEFTPDWKLSQQDQLQVHLSISLAKHIPGWPGATDEQLAAVAGEIAGDLVVAIAKAIDDEREACAKIAENALGYGGVPCVQAAALIRKRSTSV